MIKQPSVNDAPLVPIRDIEFQTRPDGTKELVWVEKEIQAVFVREDGEFYLSAETGYPEIADYYQFTVHPDLEEWASKQGCYWEWENPGCLTLAR